MKSIISSKYNFCCILIPKCATRSLLRYFVREPQEDYGAKHKSIVFRPINKFSFTFIRNPYARLVSAYLNKIKNNTRLIETLHEHNMYPDMPFTDFIWQVCIETDGVSDEHWKSQHIFIPSWIDFVGTMENLDKDFDTVSKLVGFNNYGLERINHTTDEGGWNTKPTESRDFVDFMSYYNNELVGMVTDRYFKDIELYEKVTSNRRTK